jgi:ABC-2 type transport system ATP-binding protein
MIEVQNLSKAFGRKVVVDSVTFSVSPGVVTGFLGPNGAGKTTTLKMILGLTQPTSGTALVNGRKYAESLSPLGDVGALLEARSIYSGFSARNYLRSLALTHRLGQRRVDEVIAMTGLESVASKRVKTFSLGMWQRLGIATAMLGDPHTLILDEPANGLDVDGMIWMRGLLRSLADDGRTVFLSSHMMAEMAQTVDHLIVFGRGKVVADAPLVTILQGSRKEAVRVSSRQIGELVERLNPAVVSIATIGPETIEIIGMSAPEIAKIAAGSEIVLYEISTIPDSLEAAYLNLTSGSHEYRSTPTESGKV